MDRKSENLKEEVRLKLQAIHEKESLRLFKLQEKDIKIIEFLKQGNFSDDQLLKIREHLLDIFETRPDGVCRIILELAERSGIMPSVKCWEDLVTKEQVKNLHWRDSMIREVLKRELLQTAKLMNQSSPYLTISFINRAVENYGLESVIKGYSEDMLLRVFRQVPLLRQDWEKPNRSSKYEYLQPGSILKYACNNNHQGLFQYMLKTLSEVRGESIVDTLEHYEKRLTKWCHPKIMEIIETIKAEADKADKADKAEKLLDWGIETDFALRMFTGKINEYDTEIIRASGVNM
ncbi:hypothetical protein Rin_00018810 [Candidatus Regiella insecticola 5.15]|uniref:Uncharacterized protein n=1 Tax=Candidatus Regiella insecticola 5.15 TaxID=1005043 RepID=G2H1D9_9ENTR|nr:hypothetical protein [Candidatus Regiella insecticola]EGY28174.1 hypothetical protein Rin_00018810 [Candidatus Regiella insecticola 5.15]